jgi:phosphatidylglycerol---prolipoprotein diacylglyceryl transferase
MLTYPDINPIAFRVGPLAVRWYGIAYIVGICGGWWLMRLRARRPGSGWTTEQVADLTFYSALGAVLGGRIGYVLFYNLPYYAHHPLAVFEVWHGGMSFHGGLLGALTAVWIYGRQIDKRFFVITDFVAPVVPVGLFFGRIANFINGELWGAPTSLPWGMIFPSPRAGGVPRHPSELYEALLEGVVLFTILWLYSRKPRPVMSVSALFLFFYGCFRFLVEFVRVPDPQLGYLAFGWVTMGQVLSAPMIVAGIVLFWLSHRRGPQRAGTKP